MKDLAAWLKLVHAPGIGPSTARRLLEAFRTPIAIGQASPTELEAFKLKRLAIDYLRSEYLDNKIEADLNWTVEPNNHILTLDDPHYPEQLRAVDNPPLVLYVKGDVEVLHTDQLAMVGSRNPTPTGRRMAFEFARHLAQAGLTITSGLALGVDAASHKGALAVNGLTVAVAATGLDRVYPAQHRELSQQIVQYGAIVSEFPTGTTPRPKLFPRRNRVISGLSRGVLVVEAAKRSGSLITAHHALEQGREVFAIPGSIHSPLSRGCHALIRQGAKLVETADDVLEELAPLLGTTLQAWKEPKPPEPDSLQLDSDYRRLLECIDYEPTAIDTLVERSGFPADEIASMVLILELHGLIHAAPGGLYFREQKGGSESDY